MYKIKMAAQNTVEMSVILLTSLPLIFWDAILKEGRDLVTTFAREPAAANQGVTSMPFCLITSRTGAFRNSTIARTVDSVDITASIPSIHVKE